MNFINRENGAVLAMIPFIVVILLALTGFAFFISFNRFTTNDYKQAARGAALSAVRAMSEVDCDGMSTHDCQLSKVEIGAEQIRTYFTDNPKSPLYGYKIRCLPNYGNLGECNSGNGLKLKVYWGKYIENPPNPLPTSPIAYTEDDYPMFQRIKRNTGEPYIPNAVHIFGEVKKDNPYAFGSLFGRLLGGEQYVDKIEFSEMARAASRAIYFMTDGSPSVEKANYKDFSYIFSLYEQNTSLEFDNPLLTQDASGNVTQPQDLIDLRYPSTSPPSPDLFAVQPSQFAFTVDDLCNPPAVSTDDSNPQADENWRHMFVLRNDIVNPVAELSPLVHAQEDYRCVKHFGDGIQGRDAYRTATILEFGEDLSSMHPVPTDDNIFNTDATSPPFEHHFIDFYRNPIPASHFNDHRGPEPFTSIVQGLSTAFQKFSETGGYFDKAGFIRVSGTDNGVPWSAATVLTQNYPYLQSLAESSSLIDPSLFRPAQGAMLDATADLDLPLWLQLGSFPQYEDNTPLSSLVRWAQSQLTSDDEVSDAAKSIVVFSDFLANCTPVPGPPKAFDCENTLQRYKDAMDDLNAAVDDLATSGIAFHVFPIGTNTGVKQFRHIYSITEPNGQKRCMLDSEIRQLSKYYLHFDSTHYRDLTPEQWARRNKRVNSWASYEIWHMAARTGGVFMNHVFQSNNTQRSLYYNPRSPFNLLTNGECAQIAGNAIPSLSFEYNTCPFGLVNWGIHRDRECLQPHERVELFVDQVFDDGSRFQIVPIPKLSTANYAGSHNNHDSYNNLIPPL